MDKIFKISRASWESKVFVKNSICEPERAIISPAASWKAIFAFGLIEYLSSSSPEIKIIVEPMIRLRIFLFKGIKTKMATVAAIYIAIPPAIGIGRLCILLLSFGISKKPNLGPTFITIGVSARDMTKDIKKGR